VTAYRLTILIAQTLKIQALLFFSGKKIVLGRLVVGPGSEQLDKAFQAPSLTRKQLHSIR
jgi:hypothetical protein